MEGKAERRKHGARGHRCPSWVHYTRDRNEQDTDRNARRRVTFMMQGQNGEAGVGYFCLKYENQNKGKKKKLVS